MGMVTPALSGLAGNGVEEYALTKAVNKNALAAPAQAKLKSLRTRRILLPHEPRPSPQPQRISTYSTMKAASRNGVLCIAVKCHGKRRMKRRRGVSSVIAGLVPA